MANPDRVVQIGGECFRVEEEGAWITMDLNHERIHLGDVFHASQYNGALADGGTMLYHMACGTAQPHLTWSAASSGNSRVILVEGGTVTGSSTITPYNRQRSSTDTALATITTGGTVAGGGTVFTQFIPGGSGGQRPGGQSRSDTEFVLKASTTYSLGLINGSGSNALCSLGIDFYEVSES